MLETSKLYHARLDQFDDPFEGAVTNEYARLRDKGVVEPYFTLKYYEPWTLRISRLRSYATCWHASEHESDSQWKLYASGGAGIAVVSTLERLQQSVDFLPHIHGILGQVEYVDFEHHDMRRHPFGTPMRPGLLKRKSFEHEREVRGVVLTELNKPQLELDEPFIAKLKDEMPCGITAKINLRELILAIVTSPIAAPFVKELVGIVTKRHGLDHLVRESQLRGTPMY